MITIISKEAIDKSGFSFDNAKSYALGTAVVTGGILVAHNVTRLLKMGDSVLANLGVTVVGIAGAMYFQNPWLKLGLFGLAAYSGLKTLYLSAKAVADPAAAASSSAIVAGLAGLLPESIKAGIRSILPTLGATDVSWEDMPANPISGMGELDDAIPQYNNFSGAEEEKNLLGLGTTEALLI